MSLTDKSRRKFVKLTGAGIGAATIGGLAGCSQSSDGDDSAKSVQYLIPEGQMTIPVFLAGAQSGAWSNVGVNLQPEVTGYGRYSRALTSGSSNLGNVNQAIFLNSRSNGEDVVLFGPLEKQLNGIFVNADSDIESPADLEGKRVGVPFWDSGTTMIIRAMLQDEYDLSIREDTDATSAPPSTLWNQLTEGGDLDAVLEFTTFTVKGLTDDSVRRIFDPAAFWQERTGRLPMITYFATNREWLESGSNARTTLDFLEGWSNAVENFNQNSDDVMQRYGRLAGLTSQDEIDTLKEEFTGDAIIPVEEWNSDLISNQFEILNMISEAGIVESAPSPDEGAVSYEALESMAE